MPTYDWRNCGLNDPEPINWKVLDAGGNEVGDFWENQWTSVPGVYTVKYWIDGYPSLATIQRTVTVN